MNLEQIQEQYRGSRLTSLIKSHMQTLSREILPQAIRGTLIEFPETLRPQFDGFTEDYIQIWCTTESVDADLAELFATTMVDIQAMLHEKGIQLEDRRIFDLFHIMAMKLAFKAHIDKATRDTLGLDI